MATHELKTLLEFYRAVECGAKTFEVRRNDRGFMIGDVLHLLEWDNSKLALNASELTEEELDELPYTERAEYTGRDCYRKVTYVLCMQADCDGGISVWINERYGKELDLGSDELAVLGLVPCDENGRVIRAKVKVITTHDVVVSVDAEDKPEEGEGDA